MTTKSTGLLQDMGEELPVVELDAEVGDEVPDH